MDLPFLLATLGTVAVVVLALAAVVALVLVRRQIALRWHRAFGEPADAGRARGDTGEVQAFAYVRALAREIPELSLRVFPGRKVGRTEVDLLVVTRSAVWVVECKAWRGRLAAGAGGWICWSEPRRGAPTQQRRRDPLRQARAQAQALTRALQAGGLARIPVRELVVFTHPDADLDAVRDEGFVLHLDELPAFLQQGPGGQGSPLDGELRHRVCACIEELPAWDFLELEGGGRRGRIVNQHLALRRGGRREEVALAGFREAIVRLRGWPVVRVHVQLLGGEAAVDGVAADPNERIWLRESDGQTRPYPLCLLRGFVLGGVTPKK